MGGDQPFWGLRFDKVTVVVSDAEDQVFLNLVAPTPYPALNYPASATVKTAHGYGVQWVREALGVEPEVIDVSAMRDAGPAKIG